MTDIYKKKLAEFIYYSGLKDEQKLLWGAFLKEAEPYENEAVFEAVSSSEDNLKLLTGHLASKIEEMKK